MLIHLGHFDDQNIRIEVNSLQRCQRRTRNIYNVPVRFIRIENNFPKGKSLCLAPGYLWLIRIYISISCPGSKIAFYQYMLVASGEEIVRTSDSWSYPMNQPVVPTVESPKHSFSGRLSSSFICIFKLLPESQPQHIFPNVIIYEESRMKTTTSNL